MILYGSGSIKTSQAVSRWKNGDTIPKTDTLKLISKEFDASVNAIWENPIPSPIK